MLLDASEGKELSIPSVLLSKKEYASAYVCFYLPEGQVVNGELFGGYQPRLRKISEFKRIPNRSIFSCSHT